MPRSTIRSSSGGIAEAAGKHIFATYFYATMFRISILRDLGAILEINHLEFQLKFPRSKFTILTPSTNRVSERNVFEETALPKDISQDDFGKDHIETVGYLILRLILSQ